MPSPLGIARSGINLATCWLQQIGLQSKAVATLLLALSPNNMTITVIPSNPLAQMR